MYSTSLKVTRKAAFNHKQKTVIFWTLLWKHIEHTLQYYTYFNYAVHVLGFNIKSAHIRHLWSDFKTDIANFKLLIF